MLPRSPLLLLSLFEKLKKEDPTKAGALDAPVRERFKTLYQHDDALKTRQTLREHLLYLNAPERLRVGHGAYSTGHFKLEGDDGYLGPDFETRWYNRNLRIFRNLQRLTDTPEQRVLLVIGAGHVPILRFVAQSSPEHELVEVERFLGPTAEPSSVRPASARPTSGKPGSSIPVTPKP